MSGGASGRELDQTPTWAVAVVCAIIIIISIALEKVLHTVGEIFEHKRKEALKEALEKVKGELMVLGFISLLLTFGQNYISRVCIPEEVADSMLFCPKHTTHGSDHGQSQDHGSSSGGHEETKEEGGSEHRRRLLFFHGNDERRWLAVLHFLKISLSFLPSLIIHALQTRGWKEWERECISHLDELNDPSRFRLTHETSFVRDHTKGAWTKTKFSFYFVCLFRQFFRSVRKADYCTMRHGFVSVHLTPGSKFDFQKYIKKSLEDDFKVVVGITPALWALAVLFLLSDVHGWHIMTVMSMMPLVLTLAVGTKLQAIIAKMALEIVEKHAVIQGMPLVHVSDQHFWFAWPRLVLHLIHYVLFQNAFEITYFFWIWVMSSSSSSSSDVSSSSSSDVSSSSSSSNTLRKGSGRHTSSLYSCLIFDRVVVQVMCSYITLPLYALVTQMGSTMKRSIFDEQTSKALKQWHKKAAQKTGDHGHGHGKTEGSHPKKPEEDGTEAASTGH
ncbi:hypothetical protein GQ457_12G030530 [Hibiscus cannabinus]